MVFARALGLVRQPAAGGIAGAVALKASVVALNFALIFLAARVLGRKDFGAYSIVFSAAGLLSVVATFGQQMLVMRSWSEYAGGHEAGLLKGSLIFSTAICLAGAFAAAAGFFIWLEGAEGIAMASAVGLYAFLLTLVMFSSHLVRSAVGVPRGDGHANLTAAAPPAAFLLFCLLAGQPASLATVFLLFAAGLGAALAVHAGSMRKVMKALPAFAAARPRFDVASWRPRSVKLWLSSALEASNQYLDVLIIGLMMSSSVAGAYFVTTRLANAFATSSDAVNMFATRHIPELYFRRDGRALAALLNSIAWITGLMILGGAAVLLGGGERLLAAFDPDYARYFPQLAVLSVGTAAVAAVGPSASVLMLTGHEGRYLAILATSISIRAAGFLLLIPAFGLLGAVVATSLSFVAMALQLRHFSRALTGLDCSVGRLAGPAKTAAPWRAAPAPASGETR